ncbi:hypothetical protein FH972_026735 [Carpinus fangiana]|uniref:Exosome complex component RRP45 n=1 Tax=Carpinus fangiana TaxID=176857 RepID=A0A5N6L4W6_9ROSI|nr:hypothetical protein FH972_026735 [Carpinus fangiana]
MPREAQLSLNEQAFILEALREGRRVDGRPLDAYRELNLSFGEESGVADVCLGKTRIIARISADVVAPFPDRKFEGIFSISTELSPMASPAFETGRPTATEALISRLLEKTIRRSSALDTESLCLVAGLKCFAIRADVHVISHDGNLIDTACVAVVSALQHFRRPDVTVEGEEVTVWDVREREPVKLNMLHHPLCISFSYYDGGEIVILDATAAEEKVSDGEVVISVNKYGEICQLAKYGGESVNAVALLSWITSAVERVKSMTACRNLGNIKRRWEGAQYRSHPTTFSAKFPIYHHLALLHLHGLVVGQRLIQLLLMPLFGLQPYSDGVLISIASLTGVAIFLGLFRMIHLRIRLREAERLAETRARHLSFSRSSWITIEDDETTLFGIRALEAGYFGGVVQCDAIPRQSSAMRHLHIRSRNSSPDNMDPSVKERWNFMQRLDDRQDRRANRRQGPILSLQLEDMTQNFSNNIFPPLDLGLRRSRPGEPFIFTASDIEWQQHFTERTKQSQRDTANSLEQRLREVSDISKAIDHLPLVTTAPDSNFVMSARNRSWTSPNLLHVDACRREPSNRAMTWFGDRSHRTTKPGAVSDKLALRLGLDGITHRDDTLPQPERGTESSSSRVLQEESSATTLDLEQLYEHYRSGFSSSTLGTSSTEASFRSSCLLEGAGTGPLSTVTGPTSLASHAFADNMLTAAVSIEALARPKSRGRS